jgi:hypothetical protein
VLSCLSSNSPPNGAARRRPYHPLLESEFQTYLHVSRQILHTRGLPEVRVCRIEIRVIEDRVVKGIEELAS